MKMKVDVWSDIMCPFCYIGKRKLEGALAEFEHKDDIEVVWHSYQLDPTMEHQPGKSLYEYLAERKGQSLDWAVKVHDQLVQTAKEEGLTYNFDKAVITNSFNAHRLIQLAKKYKKGDDAEERLFKAYFTEGRNVSDHDTLVLLGTEIGLDAMEIKQMLNGDAYALDVISDGEKAQALGARGVPFFVLDDAYGISGAQPKETFLKTLQRAWAGYEQKQPVVMTADGDVCENGGECSN